MGIGGSVRNGAADRPVILQGPDIKLARGNGDVGAFRLFRTDAADPDIRRIGGNVPASGDRVFPAVLFDIPADFRSFDLQVQGSAAGADGVRGCMNAQVVPVLREVYGAGGNRSPAPGFKLICFQAEAVFAVYQFEAEITGAVRGNQRSEGDGF